MLDSPDPATGRSALLADHTTLRLGGPATGFVVARTEADLIDAVAAADAQDTSALVLGGGSNLVVADAGFDGTAIRVATSGIAFDRVGDRVGDRVVVRVAAGEPWDGIVAACLAEGLAGIECLSGIPGLAGATPIQNVGAYGTEISDVVVGVQVFDRAAGAQLRLVASACGFGYRTSSLKGHDRYLVLGVEISLTRSVNSGPVHYAQLAGELGIDVGATAAIRDVRAAVLELRARKGMLLDPADPDSVSAGSFFTNPILDTADVPPGAPAWPVGDGRVKTSAAWLIEHAGFGRGYRIGPVGLSTKHTLALVNHGGASTSDLVSFARLIRNGVREAFGVTLEVEPALVGVSL